MGVGSDMAPGLWGGLLLGLVVIGVIGAAVGGFAGWLLWG